MIKKGLMERGESDAFCAGGNGKILEWSVLVKRLFEVILASFVYVFVCF